MRFEDREKIALWKFGYIAPAYNKTHNFQSNAAYFKSLEGKELRNPVTNTVRCYCKGTFENWLSLYCRNGLEGLMPGLRSDAGTFRALSDDAQRFIIDQITRYPRILNTIIRNRLLENRLIDDGTSQSTIDRFVKNYHMRCPKKDEYHEGKDRKAFEFDYANQLWQADTTYLGKIDGRQTYLMMILDDASRMAVSFEVFFADNAVNFQKILKNGVKTYGIPSMLLVDNGSPYSNHQLHMICARLGIQLIHAPPRDGSVKGKVEKSFKTLKDSIYYCEDWGQYKSLDDINLRVSEYIYTDYNTKSHGTTETDNEGNLLNARDRYLRDADRFIYKDEDEIDQIFLHRYKRKVRTDATIRYDNIFYEVPMEYIGESVTLIIDPIDLSKAWIKSAEGAALLPVSVLDRKANRKVKRRQHIKIGGE